MQLVNNLVILRNKTYHWINNALKTGKKLIIVFVFPNFFASYKLNYLYNLFALLLNVENR